MKIPFEDFDPDMPLLNADQKVSMAERAIMIHLSTLLKVVMDKTNKASTYGELYKISNFMKRKMLGIQESAEKIADGFMENPEETTRMLVTEIEEMTDELKGYRGNEF